MKNIFEKIAEDAENRRKKKRHEQEVQYNNTQIRYNERARFYRQIFDYLKECGVRGDYYEFGCHKAITFRMALAEAHRKSIDWMEFHAFDSFEGLPEPAGKDLSPDRQALWKKGVLLTSEEKFRELVNTQGFFTDKVHTVKGFYDKSLTPELQAQLIGKSKISLAVIDCDMYESTVPVLRFIEPLLQKGTSIYFDDFFHYKGDPGQGEQCAMAEFVERTGIKLNPHLSIGWFGKSFLVY